MSAKQAAATSPTYPDPITQIEIGFDMICVVSFAVVRGCLRHWKAGPVNSSNSPRKAGPRWLRAGSIVLYTSKQSPLDHSICGSEAELQRASEIPVREAFASIAIRLWPYQFSLVIGKIANVKTASKTNFRKPHELLGTRLLNPKETARALLVTNRKIER